MTRLSIPAQQKHLIEELFLVYNKLGAAIDSGNPTYQRQVQAELYTISAKLDRITKVRPRGTNAKTA